MQIHAAWATRRSTTSAATSSTPGAVDLEGADETLCLKVIARQLVARHDQQASAGV